MAAAALRQKRHTNRNHGAKARTDTLLFGKRGSVYQMRTIPRKLRTASSVMLAPAAAEDHPLKIAQFRAWRVKEPVSNRRYTVVRLQSQGGVSGYGEGGPATAPEIVAARALTLDRRATDSEFIRAALRRTPALEAAVNNAMLDLVSRAKSVPIYQYLADRSGTRHVCSVISRAQGPRIPLRRLNVPNAREFRLSLPLLRSAAP